MTQVKMIDNQVVAITPEELEEINTVGLQELDLIVRERRSALLSETDWWCLSDRTATQAQLDYRQALRDITTHPSWPNLGAADWPVKP